MIRESIEQVEERIAGDQRLSDEEKARLLKTLAALKEEVAILAETHKDDAQSVSRFLGATAHEATRSEQKPELLKAAVEGLSSSVAGIEASHPRLAQLVNNVAMALGNMGI